MFIIIDVFAFPQRLATIDTMGPEEHLKKSPSVALGQQKQSIEA